MDPTLDKFVMVGGGNETMSIGQMRSLVSSQYYKEYFVDGNVSATGQGNSWTSPYSTFAEASAASHASIALSANRAWAKRNVIWVAGDALTEDLVAFPQKTDVIGVGSYNANTMPGIVGYHAPVNTVYGCRFFNIYFQGVATGSPLVTLTSASAGVEFHVCKFYAVATTTSGILATASPDLKVKDCVFEGAFATSYVSLGAGEAGATLIKGNLMGDGLAAGIVVDSGATFNRLGYIDKNIIRAVGLCIDENSDKMVVTNNMCLSDVASTTTATLAEVIDSNVAYSANNFISCGDVTNARYPVVDETGSV